MAAIIKSGKGKVVVLDDSDRGKLASKVTEAMERLGLDNDAAARSTTLGPTSIRRFREQSGQPRLYLLTFVSLCDGLQIDPAELAEAMGVTIEPADLAGAQHSLELKRRRLGVELRPADEPGVGAIQPKPATNGNGHRHPVVDGMLDLLDGQGVEPADITKKLAELLS